MKIINKIINSELKKRFFNAILFGIGGATISKGFLMLFNIIISRLLGEKQYGIYSIINNTVQTFTVFAGAGIGITLTRYVALYREKNKEMAGIIINTLLIFNIILSFILSIIVFIFSSNISNLISEDVDITLYIRITSGTILFTSIALILQSILQGFEQYRKIAFAQIISNLIMLMIGIFITRVYGILGTIISLLLLQIILMVFFVAIIRKIIKSENIQLKFKFNEIVKEAIVKVAIPAFLASIFVVPLLWVTNFIFTNKNGYEEFAAFSVCLQWFTILNYLPQQLGQVRPIYTQLYDDGKFKEMRKVINKMMLFSIGFAIIVAIILMIGSYFILKAYGEFYTNYIIPFIIMLISSIFYAMQAQYGSIFQAIGKIWMCLGLNIVWAISFITSFALLYRNGTLGYTLTYLISYGIYAIISIISFSAIMKKEKLKRRKEELKNEN